MDGTLRQPYFEAAKLISGQLDVEDLDIDVSMTAEELAEVAGE